MRTLLLLSLMTSLTNLVYSQAIGVGTNTPHASALLDIQSNNKGLLLPRMTKTNRDSIHEPATGLLLYQTDDAPGFYSNTGTPANPDWKKLDATTGAGVPTGSIIISDQFPDSVLTNAGFSIYRYIFIDSTAQYGPFGSWTEMDTANCQYFNLNASQPPTAVGNEFIYTYGYNNMAPFESIIVRFNVNTNSWQELTNLPAGLLAAKDQPTFFWTGSELLIYGGNGANDGYRYNPATDTWTTMSMTNAPTPRNFSLSCFTGTQLVIWGGTDPSNGNALSTGSRYTLATNTWSAMTTTNAPAFRMGARAIHDGNAMYVYGGAIGFSYSDKMNKYDIVANTWAQLTPGGTDVPDRSAANLMSHNGFIFMFGGTFTPQFGTTQFFVDGYVYNTVANTWSVNMSSGIPNFPNGATIQKANNVYTFGGVAGSGSNFTYTNEIGVKNITAVNPAYTPLGNAPIASRYGSVVDTLPGNRLLFWGGFRFSGSLMIPYPNGIIYDMTNNTFHEIGIEGAPPPALQLSRRSVSGKFVAWNMSGPSNTPVNRGFIYTPDINSFGNPQGLKLYLFQKD